MQIKKIKLRDLPVWPPIWAGRSPEQPEGGVLKNVEVIPGTGSLRIDVEYAPETRVGVILTNDDVLNIMFCKLKENIGKPLAEIDQK